MTVSGRKDKDEFNELIRRQFQTGLGGKGSLLGSPEDRLIRTKTLTNEEMRYGRAGTIAQSGVSIRVLYNYFPSSPSSVGTLSALFFSVPELWPRLVLDR